MFSQSTRLVGALAIGSILALVSTATPASAQDREDTALARSLFQQGLELADAASWSEAADRFRRSLAIRDSAVVSFNLATALTHIGELVEASELLRRAARDEDAPTRLREAGRQELRRIEPRIGRLTIELEGPREGVELRLGDRPIPAAGIGVEMPVDPGEHILVATRDGQEVARTGVSIPEGGEATASLTIPPLPTVPDPVEVADRAMSDAVSRDLISTRETEAGDGDDTLLWVGVIVAVLVAGAVAATVTVLVVGGGGQADPIPGNLSPGTVEFGP